MLLTFVPAFWYAQNNLSIFSNSNVLYNLVSSNSVHTVPLTLASGNFDQLNDFSGFDGFGTFLISVLTGGNEGGGAGAHGGKGGPGAGGGGGGSVFGTAAIGAAPLQGFSCNATSLFGRLRPTTCRKIKG